MSAHHRMTSTLAAVLVIIGSGACGGESQGPGREAEPGASAGAGSSAASETVTPSCLRADGNCLGVLAPGDFASTHFAAFGSPGADQLTYAVTDSTWANALDHAAGYWFQRADEYTASNGDATLEGVYVFADAAASKQVYPACTEESDPSVPTDAASLVGWIRKLPDLETHPVDDLVTASGAAPGVRIEVVPGTFGACYDGATVRTFVASRPGAVDPYVWGITATEAIEAHFLDIGGGHTVAILLYAPSGRLTQRFVRSARDLASSFTFHEPTT